MLDEKKHIAFYFFSLFSFYFSSNSTFSAPGVTPSLELIRRCFGPTRVGGFVFFLCCFLFCFVFFFFFCKIMQSHLISCIYESYI